VRKRFSVNKSNQDEKGLTAIETTQNLDDLERNHSASYPGTLCFIINVADNLFAANESKAVTARGT